MSDDLRPGPELFELFPPLGMSGAEVLEAATASPVVAQLLELLEPHATVVRTDGSRVLRKARRLSPLANEHPKIAAGLDRARNHDGPPRYSVTVDTYGEDQVREWEVSDEPYYRRLAEACRLGVDPGDSLSLHRDEFPERVLLNTGRPPQPLLRGGREYTPEDLRAHDKSRRYYEGPHVVEQIAEAETLWELDYERVCQGGAPIQTVMVHDADNDYGTTMYPVPVGCSQERRARLIWREAEPDNPDDEFYQVCWWCDAWLDRGIDAMLVVSCGAILRVFPTCPGCHDEFVADIPVGLDFHHVSDRNFFLRGMPDDAYLGGSGSAEANR